ncbi:MAG: hypothetical protein Q8M19_16340 [Reyranella sp.]|nr:hypothetical protein [Reyranella sp.]
MARRKKTIAGAMAGAVAGLKDSVVHAEIAVVRAGNRAVKAVQDRVDAGRRKAASKKKAAKKAVKKVASKAKRAVRKATKKVTKKATKRVKRR